MKRVIALVLALVLSMTLLAACSGGSGGSGGSSGSSGSSYKAALEVYENFLNCEVSEADIEDMRPDAYWEGADFTAKDVYDFNCSRKEHWEEYNTTYTSSIGKVADEEKITGDNLEWLAEELAEEWYIDADDLQAAYELEVEWKHTWVTESDGDKEVVKDTVDVDMTAVKISGKWYVYTEVDELESYSEW